MSAAFLLDASALIALLVGEHEHHDRAAAWAAGVEAIALCPIVEGALVRFFVRGGESPGTAAAVLAELHASPRCTFLADQISYTSADLGHVMGHRQVTDAYLASLAVYHGDRLATFDRALAQARPDAVELIP